MGFSRKRRNTDCSKLSWIKICRLFVMIKTENPYLSSGTNHSKILSQESCKVKESGRKFSSRRSILKRTIHNQIRNKYLRDWSYILRMQSFKWGRVWISHFNSQLYMNVQFVKYLENKTKVIMWIGVSLEKKKNSLFRVQTVVY